MKITDGARQLLEAFIKDKGAEGIRLSSILGCCGQQFTVSLDAPQDLDKIETINGIKVAIDSNIVQTEELTIDKEDEGLVLIGASNCC